MLEIFVKVDQDDRLRLKSLGMESNSIRAGLQQARCSKRPRHRNVEGQIRIKMTSCLYALVLRVLHILPYKTNPHQPICAMFLYQVALPHPRYTELMLAMTIIRNRIEQSEPRNMMYPIFFAEDNKGPFSTSNKGEHVHFLCLCFHDPSRLGQRYVGSLLDHSY